jgi:hypothetical protein
MTYHLVPNNMVLPLVEQELFILSSFMTYHLVSNNSNMALPLVEQELLILTGAHAFIPIF